MYENEETQLRPQDMEGQHRLFVRFEIRPVYNKLKSEGGFLHKMVAGKEIQEYVEPAGKPVYDDVEYIEIANPGDGTSVIHRPIRPSDKARFSKQYQAWKMGRDSRHDGVPLAEWAAIPPSLVKTLEHFQIFTVEALASLSDGNMQNIGPISAYRAKAQAYLSQSKEDTRDAEIAALKAQLSELAAKSQTPEKSQKGGK